MPRVNISFFHSSNSRSCFYNFCLNLLQLQHNFAWVCRFPFIYRRWRSNVYKKTRLLERTGRKCDTRKKLNWNSIEIAMRCQLKKQRMNDGNGFQINVRVRHRFALLKSSAIRSNFSERHTKTDKMHWKRTIPIACHHLMSGEWSSEFRTFFGERPHHERIPEFICFFVMFCITFVACLLF